MSVVVLELDEEVGVAVARALVESPHAALVAAADPNSRAGHLSVADSYDEAVRFAEQFVNQGWRVVVWEVPSRRPGR